MANDEGGEGSRNEECVPSCRGTPRDMSPHPCGVDGLSGDGVESRWGNVIPFPQASRHRPLSGVEFLRIQAELRAEARAAALAEFGGRQCDDWPDDAA